MKKVFLIYGHYDDKSFNSAIKDTFILNAEKKRPQCRLRRSL